MVKWLRIRVDKHNATVSTLDILCLRPSFFSNTGTFRCTFCQTEVEEDESAVPKKDARTLVARFNEQIEPIYVLLRETENINLSNDLLEPEPSEIPALKQRSAPPVQLNCPVLYTRQCCFQLKILNKNKKIITKAHKMTN